MKKADTQMRQKVAASKNRRRRKEGNEDWFRIFGLMIKRRQTLLTNPHWTGSPGFQM